MAYLDKMWLDELKVGDKTVMHWFDGKYIETVVTKVDEQGRKQIAALKNYWFSPNGNLILEDNGNIKYEYDCFLADIYNLDIKREVEKTKRNLFLATAKETIKRKVPYITTRQAEKILEILGRFDDVQKETKQFLEDFGGIKNKKTGIKARIFELKQEGIKNE